MQPQHAYGFFVRNVLLQANVAFRYPLSQGALDANKFHYASSLSDNLMEFALVFKFESDLPCP